MKSGFISLIGRPNVGKSTLINSIIGSKVAIVSKKAQTTRNIIQGIYTDSEAQMVFVDTPGIHKPNDKLGQYLNKQAYYSLADSDVILFLIDITSEVGKGDKFVLEKIKEVKKPVILIINKIDKVSKESLIKKIIDYQSLYDFAEIIPLSALKKNNIKELIKVLKTYLKDEIKYYDDDQITNRSIKFLISEIIREKVFNLTEQEVPHSVTCLVDDITKKNNKLIINASIIVDRESLKKIILGKQGSKIKKIGILSRSDIENLLNREIYLDLHVKTIKNWRDKEKYLSEFGFNEFE